MSARLGEQREGPAETGQPGLVIFCCNISSLGCETGMIGGRTVKRRSLST